MSQNGIIFLVIVACMPMASAQLSAYSKWTPQITRYCETLQDPTNPIAGGVTCGISSYGAMTAFFPELQISSTVSLGLINVGWITSEALRTQAGFWRTCKPYLVRIHDGIFKNSTAACALVDPPQRGFPNCSNANWDNFNYRSGSGYCMSQKVCGASIEVSFLKSADNSSLIWSWMPTTISNFLANGFTKIGSCYTYSKKANPSRNETNMSVADEGFY